MKVEHGGKMITKQDILDKIKKLNDEVDRLSPSELYEQYQKALKDKPEGTCSKCLGFIPIENKIYGYAGKFCNCKKGNK